MKIRNKAYDLVAQYLNLSSEENEQVNIYPRYRTGTGRWVRYADYENDIILFLCQNNISFLKGNDAPRGGKHGDFLRVNRAALLSVVSSSPKFYHPIKPDSL